MDWEACLKKNARPASKDDNVMRSLRESAPLNLETAQLIAQTETSYSSIITLTYDSLRMLLEVLSLQNGYKIYNHECYTCFLREVLKLELLAEKFDPVREIRNRINYYGKRLGKDEFEVVYKDILFLIKEINGLLKKDE